MTGRRAELPAIRFGTDGWRAVIAEEFTFANVERVAQAYADYLLQEQRREQTGAGEPREAPPPEAGGGFAHEAAPRPTAAVTGRRAAPPHARRRGGAPLRVR